MELPYELWKYEIYPLLDYDSRINLNLVLPPEARGRKKFKKLQIHSHGIYCIYSHLTETLDKLHDLDDITQRVNMIMKLFRLLLSPFFKPILNSKTFRTVVVEKCNEFYGSHLLTHKERKVMNSLCNKIKKVVTKIENSNSTEKLFSLKISVYDTF
jgi:hypothetical protein